MNEVIPSSWAWTTLGRVTTIRGATLDPSVSPEVLFKYVGLDDVEKGTGKIQPIETTPGKNIGSTKLIFKKGGFKS